MVEEPLLPSDAGANGQPTFPVGDRLRHRPLRRKTHQHVQVIGHQDQEIRPPYAPITPEPRGLAHRTRDPGHGERVPSPPPCTDGDKIYGIIANPIEDTMPQALASRKVAIPPPAVHTIHPDDGSRGRRRCHRQRPTSVHQQHPPGRADSTSPPRPTCAHSSTPPNHSPPPLLTRSV